MDIVKQIIDQRVNKLVEENSSFFNDYTQDAELQKSYSFLLLGVMSCLDIDIEKAMQGLTDGGNDGGFDAAYISQSGEGVMKVVLFQSKYTRNLEKEKAFSANDIEKAVNTVKNIFDPGRGMLLNDRSSAVVEEVRSFIEDGIIPDVTFVMLNNGAKWNRDAQNYIDNEFKGQKQVEFVYCNHQDIVKYINKHSRIDETLSLKGIAIKEDFNYKAVILGRVSVEEIARILEKYGDDLLERNIRKYLGIKFIAVNKAISDTLLDDAKRPNFFFYNNGITMICSEFKHNALQREDWKVQIQGLQIINGGQTCKTIHEVLKNNAGINFSSATVLLRLYAVGTDESVIDGITHATNSQNPVDFRDLKSNDEIQVLLEKGAAELNYIYKRKKDNQTNLNVIPSSVAAEAVFAVWRKKPHFAKYKKSECFNTYYKEIFEDLNAAQMIIAVLIFRKCDSYRKRSSQNMEIEAQRRFSSYLLASIIGVKLLKHFSISVDKLTHANFNEIKNYFDANCDALYKEAEEHLLKHLKQCFYGKPLEEVGGRIIAATFRRFDFVESTLS